jgi:hypothetical protein
MSTYSCNLLSRDPNPADERAIYMPPSTSDQRCHSFFFIAQANKGL